MDSATVVLTGLWLLLIGAVVWVVVRAFAFGPRPPRGREAFADAHGLAFATGDARSVAGLPLSWLSADRFRGVLTTIWGVWRDLQVTIVDLRVVAEDEDPLPTHERDALPATRWYRPSPNAGRTAVLLQHAADVPNVRLVDRPRHAEAHEIVEGRFALFADDRLFAEVLLAPTFRSRLRALPRGARIEIGPGWLLLGLDRHAQPSRLEALLEQAAGLRDAIPEDAGRWRRP